MLCHESASLHVRYFQHESGFVTTGSWPLYLYATLFIFGFSACICMPCHVYARNETYLHVNHVVEKIKSKDTIHGLLHKVSHRKGISREPRVNHWLYRAGPACGSQPVTVRRIELHKITNYHKCGGIVIFPMRPELAHFEGVEPFLNLERKNNGTIFALEDHDGLEIVYK